MARPRRHYLRVGAKYLGDKIKPLVFIYLYYIWGGYSPPSFSNLCFTAHCQPMGRGLRRYLPRQSQGPGAIPRLLAAARSRFTLDCGTCQFMEAYDPAFTPNRATDEDGRYTFGKQGVAVWCSSGFFLRFIICYLLFSIFYLVFVIWYLFCICYLTFNF